MTAGYRSSENRNGDYTAAVAIILVLGLIGLVIAACAGFYSGLSESEPGSKRGMITWISVPIVTGWAVASNFGDSYAAPAAIGAVVLLLCYCSFRPTPSSFKWTLLAGLKVPALFVAIVSLGISGARLIYGLLSGELKNEGWAGLPVDWMMSCATLGVISIGIVAYVNFIRAYAQRSSNERKAQAYQRTEAGQKNQSHEERERAYRHSDHQEERASSSREDFANPQAKQPWWTVLEVEPTVTREDAERSGKDLMKKYHPDRMWDTPRFRAEAERQTQLINAAIEEMREALPRQTADASSRVA